MHLYNSSKQYLYNLETTSPSEARRLWKKAIKDKWDNKCAYCKSEEKLTIDHVIPQSKGGTNMINNVVCCCESCNRSKAHSDWEDWYKDQSFFTLDGFKNLSDWVNPKKNKTLYKYKPRKNKVA